MALRAEKRLSSIMERLAAEVDTLSFPAPVAQVYNPLDYARRPMLRYLEQFGTPPREVLLVGMNPGPWGMAQTGVPFGDVRMVRDWMGLEAPVDRPPQEHPKRPIQGFACPKREVSGTRLWEWARDRFGAPEHFFARFFVHNYCPLCFMEASGRNFTPDKLPAAARAPLYAACDTALRAVAETLRPRFAVGIGAFAETRLRCALQGLPCAIGRMPHPSPASPQANRGWAEAAETALHALGIETV